MGQYDKAEPLYLEALAIKKRTSGENDRDYVLFLSNLGNLYLRMGQYDKALPLDEKSLAIRKQTIGEDHPLYASSLNNLGLLYAYMGQYDKAVPLQRNSGVNDPVLPQLAQWTICEGSIALSTTEDERKAFALLLGCICLSRIGFVSYVFSFQLFGNLKSRLVN